MKRSELLAAMGPFVEEAGLVRVAQAKAQEAGEYTEAKRLAGVIGGVQRRWARLLVELLTAWVFADQSRSREKVRDWQQRTFGQAVGSGRLKPHAKPERAGGGRSGFAEPPAARAAEAAAMFKEFRKLRDQSPS